MELICPAGTPAALRAAVDAGADAVYCGFADATNARNFPGLNFSRPEMQAGIGYAHRRGAKVLVAINTFPSAGGEAPWHRAVDDAVAADADALIVADIGLLDYAARAHPDQRLHLSVQAAAANSDAIGFYVRHFGVRRVVLPRVLTVPEIAAIAGAVDCETEVFIFGGLCVMAEGRCSLSSHVTGQSPNMNGVCSPASHVVYREENGALVSRLGDFTINRVAKGEPAAYPTLCKGRFKTELGSGYLFEDPVSLDAAEILPGLRAAGVTALKIEGRQRSRAYIEGVVRGFREQLDALDAGEPLPAGRLAALTEGQRSTLGAYRKTWR
ncbi:ubiquinone anaerobic biosynthesis protein UbiU [Bradyrhizobium canariense]|uniref:Ubiquinone biosynthesis protein UbiU n=1 Tax=Bradyrhizobium canariense TaxID=255045 RepID=A0A1H2BFI5_9BRAD|nr:peptidase U32 family protein [Bradyrhizobium canariense]SDT57013.1 putative protease [Bradyrhizobium canariense]